MSNPSWPEWGTNADRYYPWHTHTGVSGDHHAGHLLDTVIGPDVETGTSRIYEVLRCESCVAIHATPLPSQEALATYYAQEFYQRDKPDYVARYERDREWWESCVHRPILRRCIAELDMVYIEDHGQYRMLDIGAGLGIALDVGNHLGLETWGIEPNPRLAGMMDDREHFVLCGTLNVSMLDLIRYEGYGPWHIVYLYEVLEHQPCPEALLLDCYDLLEDGGLLVVVVPNDYNPIQLQARQRLDIKPWWLAPPQHLFHFSPKMLQLLLRRCGFSLIDFRGTYPIDRALLVGQNYIGNDILGRQVHGQRMHEELGVVARGEWPEREALYRSDLANFRIGREIVAIARKTR